MSVQNILQDALVYCEIEKVDILLAESSVPYDVMIYREHTGNQQCTYNVRAGGT